MIIQAWWNITSAYWRHHQFATRIRKDGGWSRFVEEEVYPTIEWIEASGHTPTLQYHNPYGSRTPMQSDAFVELQEDDFDLFVHEDMFERLTGDFVEVNRPIANAYELTCYLGSTKTDLDMRELLGQDTLDEYIARFYESLKLPLDCNMSIGFDVGSLVDLYDPAYGEMIWIRNLMIHGWYKDAMRGVWRPKQLVYIEAMPRKSRRHFWNWPMQAYLGTFRKQCVDRQWPNKVFPHFDADTESDSDPDWFTTPRFCLQVRPHWKDPNISAVQIQEVVSYHKKNKAFVPQFYCKEHMDAGKSLNEVLGL